MMRLKNILVPLDGSKNSIRGLDQATLSSFDSEINGTYSC